METRSKSIANSSCIDPSIRRILELRCSIRSRGGSWTASRSGLKTGSNGPRWLLLHTFNIIKPPPPPKKPQGFLYRLRGGQERIKSDRADQELRLLPSLPHTPAGVPQGCVLCPLLFLWRATRPNSHLVTSGHRPKHKISMSAIFTGLLA